MARSTQGKTRLAGGRPGSSEKKSNPSAPTLTDLEPEVKHPVALHPFLNKAEGYLQSPLPLRGAEIVTRCIRTKLAEIASFGSVDTVLVRALLEQGFGVEYVIWEDSSACAFIFSPGAKARDIRSEHLVAGYTLARRMLEHRLSLFAQPTADHGRLH